MSVSKARGLDEIRELLDLGLAADEARELGGQVVVRRRPHVRVRAMGVCLICGRAVVGRKGQRLQQLSFDGIGRLERQHICGGEQGVGLALRRQRALGVQPADDGDDALARLRAGEAPAVAHVGDDRRCLQDALSQLGLAEAVLAVQVLADQIAEWMAHAYLLHGAQRDGTTRANC